MNSSIQVIPYSELLEINKDNNSYFKFEQLIKCGIKIVLIDLKNVTMLSSSGLITLIMAFKAVTNAGGKLFICSLNEQSKMLFELTRLDQVFETFTDLEEFNQTLLLTN